jgi:hypothetical protein
MAARIARARALAVAAGGYALRQAHLASAGVVRRRGLAQHDVFYELHNRVLRAHAPERYTGAAVVLASPAYFADSAALLDRVLPPLSADGHRRDVPVNAEHLDLLREPSVAEVARALDLVFSRLDDEVH